MKAMVYTRYGAPEVLQLKDLEKPVPKADEVLIRVRAVEATKADCELRSFQFPVSWFKLPLRIVMGWSRPKRSVLGAIFPAMLKPSATPLPASSRVNTAVTPANHTYTSICRTARRSTPRWVFRCVLSMSGTTKPRSWFKVSELSVVKAVISILFALPYEMPDDVSKLRDLYNTSVYLYRF